MALKSDEKIITKVCKYWSKNEPEVCDYWDSSNTKCSNSNEIHPTYFPNCNLIGTAHQCNLYTGKKTEARCILPDPLRGGTNRKTGQKWITRDPKDKTKFIGFEDITCYGDEGFCDKIPEDIEQDKEHGYGVGKGLSSKCSGYNPSELEFGNYFDVLPLDLQIYNLCGKLGRCLWWPSNASVFTLDDDGGIEYPTSICKHTDAKAKEFKTVRYDEEKGIFILPCNGAASSCPFYTGIKWEYCVTDKLYPGCKILAEQIQEIRYYFKKNNWTEKSFSETFHEPIIYAWDKSKGYQIDETNFENKDNTNIFFPKYDQTPSVVSVIEVKIPKFSTFKLEFRNIELSKSGTKEKKVDVDYPTLIEQLPLPLVLPPVILNKFDTEEDNIKEDGTEEGDNNIDEEENDEEEKTNIFEMVDIHDDTILLIGETRYYNSKPYAINLTLDTVTEFPIELHIYESLFDIKKNVSSDIYNTIYDKIDNRLTYYINYNQKPLGVDNTPKLKDNLIGGEFFINIKTIIGDNTILVFDKGSGFWEYSKVNVKVNYHGVVIAQTEFHVESTGNNIEYPPYYPASFCGVENPKVPENKRIKFELKTFGGGETEICHVYNDYVIENEYEGKKYEAGYIPYETTIKEGFDLKYDDGDIIPIGNAGYLLLVIPDKDKLLHSTYRSWTINDAKVDSEIKLKIEFTPEKQKKDKNGEVLKGQKTVEQLEKEAEDKAFELEIFMRAGTYLPDNQLIVKPKDIYKVHGVGPGCFITIEKIVVYEKKSFGEVSEGKETDYIKQSIEINGEDEIIPKENVFCKNETKFELIDETHGMLTSITDETLFISVVFKSVLTGRILGVTRTKMIVWIRNPSCRAVPIFYKWATEYEEFDLVPITYFDIDKIGIVKRPGRVSYINIKYAPGFGDFIMHPFIFSPSKALYVMDDDVIEYLQAKPEDYVIEYYRTSIISGLKTVYERQEFEDARGMKWDWEYTKSIKVDDPKKITYTPDDIEHGYFDMCKLCNPKNNVTIWLKKTLGGFRTFCLTNFAPANLVGKTPPDFVGAALYYAGISIKYYEYCMKHWPLGIINSGFSVFNMEYNYGKFGGGTREVMDSYRSVDNVCYDTGVIEFEEYFKDMTAFEKFKSDNTVSKLKADLIEAGIKKDCPEYFFRKWMPIYDTFSASDLNSNLINHPFNEYTFDLKSPYYHPFSIYTVETIDDININEVIKPGNTEPPDGYDSEKDGEYIAPLFKKFKFDSVFNCETFESTFLGEMNDDGSYDEFNGASGIVYPNKSGQNIDYANDTWLIFKEAPKEEGEGEEAEGEEGEVTESIQWAWREREAIIDRYVNSGDLKDYVNEIIEEQQNENFNFDKPTINAPYVMVNGNEEDVTGIFQWLPIKHPDCFFDYYLKEWDLTKEIEEGEEGSTKINVLFLKDKKDGKDIHRDGIFFIQLNDGPPRGIDKNGKFDPKKMLDLESIKDFDIPDLYELYTTCTKKPWSTKVTLFDTGFDSIEVQDAIDDDRYYYLEKPFKEKGAETDNKLVFQRGLSTLSGTVASGIGIENFNGEDLPNIRNLIEEDKYEIKASHIPDIHETKSSYTSIEPNEWFPNADYCYNIVYKDDKCPSLNMSFKFQEKKDISKIVCQFKCGKKRVEESDLEWTEKIVITDNLYNVPGVNIEINNNIVYSSDIIEFYVEGEKKLNNEKKKKFINGDVEDSVIGSVNYANNSDNIEDVFKIYEWPVNLLEDTTRSKELTISFRIDPNYTELKNANLIDTKYVFENKNEIVYTKHCLHLDCIYLYNSKLVNTYEKIKVNNRGYFISTGKHGDFQPNKFDVSNIERAFLKEENGKGRIPTLTQVDNFDGMVFYPDSDKECISINKCRGRLVGEVQKKEKESFVEDGKMKSGSSGKTKKTIAICEKKQNELYQNAINKGKTEFVMKSMCPPGLKIVLDKLKIEFPIWECKFTNKMVLSLCEVLDVEPIEPEGYYFDWGLDNILKRRCVMVRPQLGQWMDPKLFDCFDGYKLKSYYDNDKIIGVSMTEVWATSHEDGRVGSSPVQTRRMELRQTGWTTEREQDEDENRDFFDTLIEFQNKHSLDQEIMRIDNEKEIEDLEYNNLTALNDLFIEYKVKIDAEEDASKVNMEVEYVEKKYDMIIEQQTILADINISQIDKWSQLIVTQYGEIGNRELVFQTPLGFEYKDKAAPLFQGKFTLETKQTIESLRLEKKYNLEKIELEKEYDIKIVENKKREDYTIIETIDEIKNREEKQKELEDEYEEKLEELEDTYKDKNKELIEKQNDEMEKYFEDNEGIKGFYSADTLIYIREIMYNYGTQAQNKEFEFADMKAMSDVVVDLGANQDELEDYGEGELFEVQREAYYNLLKEKELTTDVFPAPIMAYYIKKRNLNNGF